jgi:hypothetical protein
MGIYIGGRLSTAIAEWLETREINASNYPIENVNATY